ncbi:MAG: extracellular solute-binding protein [Clostridia bacterium]|nr:extracellular solute-binding protein [Clostridia bacterium]
MFRKIILSLLILSPLVTVLAGCNFGKKTEDEEKTSAEATETTSATTGTTERGSDDDTIAAYDFDGDTFTILTKEDTKYEFFSSAGLGGTVLDRAIYKRNYNVANRFNANLEIVGKVGYWDARNEFLSVVRAEAMGGDGGYDLVSTHSVYLGWMTVEGLAYDMATLPEMNFSKAWWNQNLYDEVNINGHVYFMLGDICATTYEYMQVMFFNEDMFTDYFQENSDVIYDMVQSGEWTWSECMEYAKQIGAEGGDVQKYGMATNIHSWHASFVSQEAFMYQRNADNEFYFPSAPSDKLITVIENMIDFYNNDNIMYHCDWSPGTDVLNPMFSGGQALFYPQMLGEASKIATSMSADAYGVIPLPKYDTYQEQYHTICRDTVSAVMIITTTDAPEMSGVLTEALCMESYNTVTPEYYEIVLKTRYFSEAKYAEILDMIREGLTIVPVANYVENAPNFNLFHTLILDNKKDVVSTYSGSADGAQNLLDSFYAKLKRANLY